MNLYMRTAMIAVLFSTCLNSMEQVPAHRRSQSVDTAQPRRRPSGIANLTDNLTSSGGYEFRQERPAALSRSNSMEPKSNLVADASSSADTLKESQVSDDDESGDASNDSVIVHGASTIAPSITPAQRASTSIGTFLKSMNAHMTYRNMLLCAACSCIIYTVESLYSQSKQEHEKEWKSPEIGT